MVRNSQRYKNTLSLTFQRKISFVNAFVLILLQFLLKFSKVTKMPPCKKNDFRKKTYTQKQERTTQQTFFSIIMYEVSVRKISFAWLTQRGRKLSLTLY